MTILCIKCNKCLQVLICLKEHTQVLLIYVLLWKTKQVKELMSKCNKMLTSFWIWRLTKLNLSLRILSKDTFLRTFSKENSQANWSVLNVDTLRLISNHFMFWLFQFKVITIFTNLLMVLLQVNWLTDINAMAVLKKWQFKNDLQLQNLQIICSFIFKRLLLTFKHSWKSN